MSEKKESKIHPFVWPALGIFIALALLLALMLSSDRQYGPGQAYLNQNTGGVVYDRDPGSGFARPGNVQTESPDADATSANSADVQAATVDSAAEDTPLSFYEILAAGIGAAKGVEPGPDAAQCEGHCDCPQGHVCRPDVGRCVEAADHPIYCCVKDGCPAGEVCVQPNGADGACGAIEATE